MFDKKFELELAEDGSSKVLGHVLDAVECGVLSFIGNRNHPVELRSVLLYENTWHSSVKTQSLEKARIQTAANHLEELGILVKSVDRVRLNMKPGFTKRETWTISEPVRKAYLGQ